MRELFSQSNTANEDTWLANIKANVIQAGKYKDIFCDEMRQLRGKNIVVICAGPSLDENRGRLKELIDRGYKIICMARSYPCIEPMMIRPDYMLLIDSTEQFNNYAADDKWFKNVSLICDTKINPYLFKNWPGQIYTYMPIYWTHEDEAMSLATQYGLGRIPAFGHASGFARLFLLILQANDVVFLGNDYWYYGHEFWDEIENSLCFLITKYYAQPLNHSTRKITYRKYDRILKIPVVSGEPIIRHTYPYPDKRFSHQWFKRVKKYTDDHLQENLRQFDIALKYYELNKEELNIYGIH